MRWFSSKSGREGLNIGLFDPPVVFNSWENCLRMIRCSLYCLDQTVGCGSATDSKWKGFCVRGCVEELVTRTYLVE